MKSRLRKRGGFTNGMQHIDRRVAEGNEHSMTPSAPTSMMTRIDSAMLARLLRESHTART
uniref:Uncharacterized protein n=1 Tax=Oryza nivara TaxID=4536 RepID=A0A0E0HY18_ORYNI